MLELITLLMLKHATCDLALQRWRPQRSKTNYFSPGIQLHSMDHGVSTAIICAFFVAPGLALLAGIVDYFCHSIIDCTKSNLFQHYGIQPASDSYWSWQTVDQIAHYLTYYGIVYFLFK